MIIVAGMNTVTVFMYFFDRIMSIINVIVNRVVNFLYL